MLKYIQLKYTSSSNKHNGKKSYQKKYDTYVNVVEPTTQNRNQEKKHESFKDTYQLPMNPNRMLKDYLEKGLIKRVKGK